MAATARTARPDPYLELIQKFPLRPLRTEADHQAAGAVAGHLIGLVRKLTRAESDYFEVLVPLIKEYEKKHHEPKSTLQKVSGRQVLQHIISESGTTLTEFGHIIGVGKSAASMILSGQRDLTKSHITKLSRHFKIGPAAFFE